MVTVHFLPRTISIIAKGKYIQGPSETIIYTLSAGDWTYTISGTPTILKAVNILDPTTDLKSTVFPSGSVTASGTNIILPGMQSLTLGLTYKVYVNFTDGSNTFEMIFIVQCK
jgi:hypothetical protein